MRVIDADELLKTYKKWIPQLTLPEDEGDKRGVETCIAVLEDAPTLEVVSKSLFDQIKWERDIAIEQLEGLGLSLGQKIDGVYLTKEEYEKLREYKYMYEDLCR